MSIASEMRALCDNIASASADRAKRLGSLRHEAGALRHDARRMLKGFHESFGVMARELRATLEHESGARKRKVAGLRSKFRRNICAVRADLAAAKRIWATIAKRR